MKYRELKTFLGGLTEEQLEQTLTLFIVDGETTTQVAISVLEDDLINPDGEGLEPREAHNDPDDEVSMDYYLYAEAIFPKGTVCMYAWSEEPEIDTLTTEK